MKYDKKLAKHYSRLSEKDFRELSGSSIFEKTKNASALLIGECAHFSASGKPVVYAEEDAKKVIEGLKKTTSSWEEQLELYGLALKALVACRNTTGNTTLCDAPISYLSKYITNAFENCMEEIANMEDPFGPFSAFDGLSDYYKFSNDEKVKELAFSSLKLISQKELSHLTCSVYNYLAYARGLANFALLSGEHGDNDAIGALFDNYCFSAQSVNYEASLIFNDKSTTNPAGSSKAMELAVLLYNLTGDERFHMMARRIWFNGMQFCQRITGGVGFNTFTTGKNNLKVATFEVKDFFTPLYGEGLKCYSENKQLFEESDGTIFKDRNGRILMADKVFAKDESGFFGSNLIEIPTLTSFEKETALQLDLKINF